MDLTSTQGLVAMGQAQHAEKRMQAMVGATAGAATSGKREEIRETAEKFEAMFLSEMVKNMFSGIEVDPMFGGGYGEEVFRSMLVEEFGKAMGAAGGIGLADHVERQMLQMQEVSHDA